MKIIYQQLAKWARVCIALFWGLFTSHSVQGQEPTIQWQKLLESPASDIVTGDIQAEYTNDGHILVLQAYTNATPTVSKISANGSAIFWTTPISLPRVIEGDSVTAVYARKLIRAQSGGYFVIGQYKIPNKDNYYFFLTQLSLDGKATVVSTIKVNSGLYAFTDAIATTDGGFLIVGNEVSFQRGFQLRSIYKLSASGQVQWKDFREFDARVPGPFVYSATNAPDGGYMLAGEVYPYNFNGTSNRPFIGGLTTLIDKGSSDSITTNAYRFDAAVRAIQPATNGYIVSGDKYYSSDQPQWSGVIAKTSLTGEPIWSLPVLNRSSLFPVAIATAKADEFVIGDNTGQNGSTTDIRLTKVNNKGAVLWERTFGGTNNDGFRKVVAAPDGGYLVTGLTNSQDGDLSSRQGTPVGRVAGWLIKLGPESAPPPATALAISPVYDCNMGQLTVNTHGGNGLSIDYQIIGLRGWSANNVFTVPAYQRSGTTFTIQARQNGQEVSLPFTTACGITPPVDPGTPPSGQFYLRTPDYDCSTGKLTAVYSNGDGSEVQYQIIGLRGWSTSPEFTVPPWQRTETFFTIEARTATGKTAQLGFTTACGTITPPPSTTQPTSSGLSFASPTLRCNSGPSGTQLLINLVGITPDPSSGIEYKIPGLADWQRSNAFAVPGWQANGTVFTLYVRRNGTEYTTTFTTNCGAARLGNTETESWQARVMPNPVTDQVVVELIGASGYKVQFQLLDLAGRSLNEQQVTVKTDVHQQRMNLMSQSAGVYLLRVTTAQKSQTLKVMKQ